MHLYTNYTDVYAAHDRADIARFLSPVVGHGRAQEEAREADQLPDDRPYTICLDTAALPPDPVEAPDGATVRVQAETRITATGAQWAAWAIARGDTFQHRSIGGVER